MKIYPCLVTATALVCLSISSTVLSQPSGVKLPSVRVGTFEQQVAEHFKTASGLPSDDVLAIAIDARGDVYAGTAKGLARLSGDRWVPVQGLSGAPVSLLASGADGLYAVSEDSVYRVQPGSVERIVAGEQSRAGPASVHALALTRRSPPELILGAENGLFLYQPGATRYDLPASAESVRTVGVGLGDLIVVGTDSGLFLSRGSGTPGVWSVLHPRDGVRSWGPADVRALAFDRLNRLWFASPQGVGRYDPAEQSWTLFTGAEGLPYDDFTCVAAGREGEIWFGTMIGAIRYDGSVWEYRQGRRWLPGDEVRSIAVDDAGNAWLATNEGVGVIRPRSMTLGVKAGFFEDEIDKYHRRTPFEYVNSVSLARPGEKDEWTRRDSDNDGLWTAMYGAGECFAYAATKSAQAKQRAKKAFEALRFLGLVTRGGSHPAPPGFAARTILPTSGPDPNLGRLERDRRTKAEQDSMWKVIDPRWPISEDGQWYWKSDTSSDELDGHFFFYALYYDLVAESEEEKQRVREVILGMTDHLIEHGFSLVDHDGKPTRWANFGPQELNYQKDWWEERGLNSLSIISYLRVAQHVSGDEKYGEAARRLIEDHAYAMNITVPKMQSGPGTGNQSDDEMAFMCFYNLIKYEKDPDLRQIWTHSFFRYWQVEAPEMNPLFNFMAASSCMGEIYRDAFGVIELSPGGSWLEDAVDALKRYPLDRVQWALRNSHRKDVVPLPGSRGDGPAMRGHRRNGKVLPIDERMVEHWNHDPWRLDSGGNGTALADGASFLLPYYMGLYHGILVED